MIRMSPRSEWPVPLKWVWLKPTIVESLCWYPAQYSYARGLVDSVDVVRDGVRVGTQRNDSVRYAGTGENVSHFVGADDRVDLVYRAALLGRQGGCARQQTKR